MTHWSVTLGDESLRPFSTDLLVLLVSLGSVILEVKYLVVMDTDSWLNT